MSGGAASFVVELPSGRYLELGVEQLGIDVVATLYGPGDDRVIEIDSPNGSWGPEWVPLVTDREGRYRLELRASSLPGARGAYRLATLARRPATAHDRARFAVEQDFATVQRLQRQGRAASLVRAREQYLGLVDRWLQLELPRRAATTLLRLGDVERALGHQEAAADAYREALEDFRQLGEPQHEAVALNRLGLVRLRQGDPRLSTALFNRSLELAEKVESLTDQAIAIHNLGLAHVATGRYRQALSRYRRALALFRDLGQAHEEAATLSNLGEIRSSLGEWQLASDRFSQALALMRDLGDRRGEGVVLNNLGLLYGRTGELAQAEAHLLQALSILEEAGHGIAVARALNNLGWIRTRRGAMEDAAANLTDALVLARRLGDAGAEARIINTWGWWHSAGGDGESALRSHRRALRLFEALEDPAQEAQALYGLASALRERGELASAQAAIEQAVERIESVRTDLGSAGTEVAFFANKHDLYRFLIDLLMERHRHDAGSGWARRAFEVSERARARAFVETLDSRSLDADPAFLLRQAALQAEINEVELQRTAHGDPEPPGTASRSGLDRLQTRLLAELDHLRTDRRSGHRGSAVEPLSLTEIQSRILDPETTLLHYQLGEKRSFVWVITATSLVSRELAGEAEIESRARAAWELLRRSDRRRYRASAEQALSELAASVLWAVEDHLRGRRLVVVADGALHVLPFGVLPRRPLSGPSRSSEPLLADYEVAHLPSASVLALLRDQPRERGTARTLRVAVLADPVYHSGDPRLVRRAMPSGPADRQPPGPGEERWPRLAASAREAETIRRLLPPKRRLVALGSEVSRQLVLSGRLSGYSVLHFATHSRNDAAHPELSGLVLSLRGSEGKPAAGHLRVHEIEGLRWPVELVVLSGCETALGKTFRGEGVLGLPRAFLVGGARRVIVSLFSVRDQATAELMSRFYRHLLDRGLSPAAALRAAQLSMLGDPLWRAPASWAAFELQGDWRPLGADL